MSAGSAGRFPFTRPSRARSATLGGAFLAVLVAGMLVALTAGALAIGFSDVPVDHPYAVAITDLTSRGAASGYPDGTFRPDAPIARQQFAKMVVKTLGLTISPADAHPFVDVPTGTDPTDPFYPDSYIAVCYTQGLIEAKTPITFEPFAELSRAELVSTAARMADLPDPPADHDPPFADSSSDHYDWAREAAFAGLLEGIAGMGPDFDFLRNASRGECAQVLYNLLLLPTRSTDSGTAAATPVTVAALQVSPTTETRITTAELTQGEEATTTTSLPEAVPILRNPYSIASIGVIIIAIFAAILILVRQRRSGQSDASPPPEASDAVAPGEDARAVLRDWKRHTRSQTGSLGDFESLPDPNLWDKLVESAELREAEEVDDQRRGGGQGWDDGQRRESRPPASGANDTGRPSERT